MESSKRKSQRPFDWGMLVICFNITVAILALISFVLYGIRSTYGWGFLFLGLISLWIWYVRIAR